MNKLVAIWLGVLLGYGIATAIPVTTPNQATSVTHRTVMPDGISGVTDADKLHFTLRGYRGLFEGSASRLPLLGAG